MDVVALGLAKADAKKRYALKQGLLGYRAAAFGDSITATTNDVVNNAASDSWFTYLCFASNGRLRWAGNYAQGGTTSAQILTQMQSVFASQFLTRPFDVAFINAGVNDSLDGSNLPNPTAANIKAMVALCRQNGVRPVLATLVPGGIVGGLGAPTAAPSVVGTTGGGTLAAGTYYYAYTRTNFGETPIGPASASVTLASPGNVVVTLPADKGCNYNVYRSTTGGAGTWTKVATLGFATTSSWVPMQTWTDTGAAAGAAPPSVDGTSGQASNATRLKLQTISRWIRQYAAQQGIDCIEFQSFADGNGQWPVATSKDGTHPTPQTSRRMGQSAWAQVQHRFPAAPAQLTSDSFETVNIIPNGCFTNLNGSQLPQSWGGSGGSGNITRAATSGKAGFTGNAYSLTRTDATPYFDGPGGLTTGWSVGDLISFAFMVQTEGVEASNALVTIGLKANGSTGATTIGQVSFGTDIGPAVWVTEAVVPPGTTSLQVNFNLSNAGNVGASAPSAKVSLGQVTAYNLTTGQLLTA